MRVRFWGTRGSLAKPGPETVRYGGNTSCVEVESAAGTLLVIDCGTGSHGLGQKLIRERPHPLRGHILISHTHWDHIQGIPFFAPLFIAGNEWDFYAPQGFGTSLQETLAGQMEYTYFPVTLDALAANVRYHDLVEGSLQIEDIAIRTRYLNHPALTLAFRIEVDGVAIVYACDHEPHDRQLACAVGDLVGEDRAHAEFLRDADLVIHDAQYTAEEYPHKVGWGHSTVDYAVHVCRSVGVKRLALTHHDPMREDAAVDRVLAELRQRAALDRTSMEVFAAAEGMQLLLGDATAEPSRGRGPSARTLVAPQQAEQGSILLLDADDALAALAETLSADGFEVDRVGDPAAAAQLLPRLKPSLVLLEGGARPEATAALCARWRRELPGLPADLPLIVVTAGLPEGEHPAVSDWLLRPFTPEYLRTRVRAWLLRTQCRWQRAALPGNEAGRLQGLHALRILDTPNEERFDRFTRLAAAALDMPIALVSLVDADRQWFKSCVGLEHRQTPRDSSFCAHAIHQRELFVVADTLLDPRFADNPYVVDDPRIRFYAGRPLWVEADTCVGTLCVADHRPRQLDVEQAQVLDDLARMVEQELRHYRPPG